MSYLEILGTIVTIIVTLGLLALPSIQYFTTMSSAKRQSDNQTKLQIRQSEINMELQKSISENEAKSKLDLANANNYLKKEISDNEVNKLVISTQQTRYEMVADHVRPLFEKYIKLTLKDLYPYTISKFPDNTKFVLSTEQKEAENLVLLYAPKANESIMAFRAAISQSNSPQIGIYAVSELFEKVVKSLSESIGTYPIKQLTPNYNTDSKD